uniref:Uncharacterized protein n=1 Tax=Ditylenchus dipsaci TaxID=166011 RepID=A0A915DZ04_9BILA
MTTAESELLGRNASYDVTDMSVGKPGLFERLKHKADDFREYVSTTCCACLASIPSFALVILGVVLVMLLVASIPLAFALTYMKGDPAAAEVPISPIRLFRDHMEWVNDSYSAPEPMIFQSSSVLRQTSLLAKVSVSLARTSRAMSLLPTSAVMELSNAPMEATKWIAIVARLLFHVPQMIRRNR